MSSASPPKPWERGSAGPLSSASTTSSAPTTNPMNSTLLTDLATATASSQPPALPSRPSTLNAVVNRTASNYSPYGATSRLAASPYAGVGGYNNYTSPYSRFGGMGNSMYGGIGGGYGGMYGGMGGMYGGMGQPAMAGMPGVDPNDPNSLTNSFSQSTQATFQIIESLVSAFGGFAQMLESTYMATHSSFFAMVSMAEQFTNLRTTLGSILGIFTLLRYIRTLFAKITGRPPPADATSLTPSAFAAFRGISPASSPANQPPTPSKKPFLVFLLAAFGLPYLMSKLIRSLASSQIQPHPYDGMVLGPDGTPLPDQQPLDPLKLEFCRVLYDYNPESATKSTVGIDLAVKKGDLVAVLSKCDPMGQNSEWWRCRTRDRRVGYLPGIYLEAIRRKGDLEDGRAETMSSVGSTADSLKVEGMSAMAKALAPKSSAKVGVVLPEHIQKE